MQSLIQLYYFLQFLCKLPRKDTHVTALTFSPDGDRIALAYSVAGQRVRMKCAYIDDKHVILGLIPFVCFSLNCGARDSSVGKKPGFAIYRLQVRASLLVGFFWYGPLASPPPPLQIALVQITAVKKWRSQPVNGGQDHSTFVNDPPLPSR